MRLEFASLVYAAVKRIPRGKVTTYKEVARAIGKPRAWRAVGNALNKNKDKWVPCHRVVRSNLKVGGYSVGTREKVAKLKAEGVVVLRGKVQKRFLFTFPFLHHFL